MIKKKYQNKGGEAKTARRSMRLIGRREEPMADGKRFVSMRVKFVAVLGVTGVSVLAAALVLIPLTLYVFRSIYMRPDNVEERLDDYVSSFASYVAEESVRSDDAASVVRWTRRNRAVYLTVFHDENHQFGAAGGELWEGGEEPDLQPFFGPILSYDSALSSSADESSKAYFVRFANGVYSVALVDYSMSVATDIIITGGVLLAVCVFFVIMLIYYHYQTRDIVLLSREVEEVRDGALRADIAVHRNDEIGQLAEDVNAMRDTILEKMAEKEQAWQANSDLLTSMTHDIRTPLTSLLGYLELLSGERGNLTEDQETYLRICTQKAEQIKGLSDQLFLYFWAYNRSLGDLSAEMEAVEAGLLMEQLIGDYIPALEAAGLAVQTDLSAIGPTDVVRVHVDHLRRVIDNVFGNVLKYADTSHPVRIRAERRESLLTVSFANAVGSFEAPADRTRVGVKSCVHMMQSMKGSFETSLREDTFTAVMTLPVTVA